MNAGYFSIPDVPETPKPEQHKTANSIFKFCNNITVQISLSDI